MDPFELSEIAKTQFRLYLGKHFPGMTMSAHLVQDPERPHMFAVRQKLPGDECFYGVINTRRAPHCGTRPRTFAEWPPVAKKNKLN
jgi:hypothetical protein